MAFQTTDSAAMAAAVGLYVAVFVWVAVSCMYDSFSVALVHNRTDASLVPLSFRLMLTIMLIPVGVMIASVFGPPALKQLLVYVKSSYSDNGGRRFGLTYGVAIYGILWAPLSFISAARSYRFAHPLLWPLKPFAGIVMISWVAPTAGLAFFKKHWKRLILVFAASAVVQAVVSIALAAVPRSAAAWIVGFGWKPPQIIAAVALLFIVLLGGQQTFAHLSDRRRLVEFLGKRRRFDEEEFVATVRTFKLPKYAAHFCRIVRDGSSINFSDDAGINLLRDLERTKRRPKIAIFLAKMGFSEPIPVIHPDVQDEIFKLIEARRRLGSAAKQQSEPVA